MHCAWCRCGVQVAVWFSFHALVTCGWSYGRGPTAQSYHPSTRCLGDYLPSISLYRGSFSDFTRAQPQPPHTPLFSPVLSPPYLLTPFSKDLALDAPYRPKQSLYLLSRHSVLHLHSTYHYFCTAHPSIKAMPGKAPTKAPGKAPAKPKPTPVFERESSPTIAAEAKETKPKIKKAGSKSVGGKAPADGKVRKRTKSKKESWTSYIYKVLKQVHPDTGS